MISALLKLGDFCQRHSALYVKCTELALKLYCLKQLGQTMRLQCTFVSSPEEESGGTQSPKTDCSGCTHSYQLYTLGVGDPVDSQALLELHTRLIAEDVYQLLETFVQCVAIVSAKVCDD